MKRNLLFVAVSALALSVTGLFAADDAKPKRPGGGAKADPAKRAEMMIKNGDTDGDGKLSKDELVAMFEKQAANRKAGGDRPKKPKTD